MGRPRAGWGPGWPPTAESWLTTNPLTRLPGCRCDLHADFVGLRASSPAQLTPQQCQSRSATPRSPPSAWTCPLVPPPILLLSGTGYWRYASRGGRPRRGCLPLTVTVASQEGHALSDVFAPWRSSWTVFNKFMGASRSGADAGEEHAGQVGRPGRPAQLRLCAGVRAPRVTCCGCAPATEYTVSSVGQAVCESRRRVLVSRNSAGPLQNGRAHLQRRRRYGLLIPALAPTLWNCCW